MSTPQEMGGGNPTVNGENEKPIEAWSYGELYGYLVTRSEPLVPLLKKSLSRPALAVELYAALTDRVFSGKGEHYAALYLRGELAGSLRHTPARIALPSEMTESERRHTIEAPSEESVWKELEQSRQLYEKEPAPYWDDVLNRVAQAACTASELQLTLDSLHAERQRFAIVRPPLRVRENAAHKKFSTLRIRHTPEVVALARVQRAIISFAEKEYSRSDQMSKLEFAQVAAEATLREMRATEEEYFTTPDDIVATRDRRLLRAQNISLRRTFVSQPKAVRKLIDDVRAREQERQEEVELRRQVENREVTFNNIWDAVVKVLVREVPPPKP